MNYFELYDLPISIKVDRSIVLKKYYALSKQFHPDTVAQSDDKAKAQALLNSSDINKAKRVLDQPLLRIEHILQIHHALSSDEKQTLSPFFLAEMMELNEDLAQHASDGTLTEDKAKLCIEPFIVEAERTIAEYKDKDELVVDTDVLENLKNYYFKRKYIDRVVEQFLNQ
ncbi:MAG: hypothetical protein R2831_12090 [Chitinophagaceae bacterium]